MKCKAKWNKNMQDWILYCEEHDTYTTYVQGTYSKRQYPHDMALSHVRQHHKGE